jgi:small-conductance mechanosensitive channel
VTLEKLSSLNWITVLQAGGGIVLTIAASIVIIRLARRGLEALGRRQHIATAHIGMMRLLVRWLVLVVAALLIITQLGIRIGSLWAVLSAFLAIAGIGFVAVWSMLSNVSSTILLLVFHPFAIGDEIEVIEATGGAGLRGKVTGINFMYTTIEEKESQTGEVIDTLVPNNTFFQKTIRRRPGRGAPTA